MYIGFILDGIKLTIQISKTNKSHNDLCEATYRFSNNQHHFHINYSKLSLLQHE